MVWLPDTLVEERVRGIARRFRVHLQRQTRWYMATLVFLLIVLAITVVGFWIYHARVAQVYREAEAPKERVRTIREFGVVEEKTTEKGVSRRWRITLVREEPPRWHPTVEERGKLLLLLEKGKSYRLRTAGNPNGLLENSYAAPQTPQKKSASARLPLEGLMAGIPILPFDDAMLFLRWTPDSKENTDSAAIILEQLDISGDEYRRLLHDRSITVQNVLFPDP